LVLFLFQYTISNIFFYSFRYLIYLSIAKCYHTDKLNVLFIICSLLVFLYLIGTMKSFMYYYPCISFTLRYWLYITTYRVTGHIPWWHQLKGDLLLIVIVLAVITILVLILICVAIYIVCRRRRQMRCKLSLIYFVICDRLLIDLHDIGKIEFLRAFFMTNNLYNYFDELKNKAISKFCRMSIIYFIASFQEIKYFKQDLNLRHMCI